MSPEVRSGVDFWSILLNMSFKVYSEIDFVQRCRTCLPVVMLASFLMRGPCFSYVFQGGVLHASLGPNSSFSLVFSADNSLRTVDSGHRPFIAPDVLQKFTKETLESLHIKV